MGKAGSAGRVDHPSRLARVPVSCLLAVVLPFGAVAGAALVADPGEVGLAAAALSGTGAGAMLLLTDRRYRVRRLTIASRRMRRFLDLGVLETGGPYPGDELGRLLAQVDDVCLRLDDARREAERALHLDHLTGALTRRAAEQRLAELARQARRSDDRLTVALIDIDRFKSVNDRLGHAAGDAALRHAVDILQRSLRGIGFVARWGGDELLVAVRGPSDGVARGLDRARRAIADRLEAVLGQRVTMSAGLAEVRPHETVGACLALADGALYLAKSQGRDRVVDGTRDVLTLPG